MKRFLLIILLTSPISLSAAVWYDEYDAALKAVSAKNWSLAETRLKTALRLQPKQGRQVLAYGVRFIRYIPDYYLGVVYFNQGKHQDALNQLQRIQKSGLIRQVDPEFQQMTNFIQLATEQLKPKVEEKKVPIVSPVHEETKPKENPQEPIPAGPLEKEIQKPAETETAEVLKQTNLAEKLTVLSKAMGKKDWLAAQKIVHQVELLDPKNRELSLSRPVIEKGLAELKARDLEDRGLLAFLSGDYQQASTILATVVSVKNDSAAAWFYLGCSHAALALLQGKEGQQLIQKAQGEFVQSRKLDHRLNYHSAFISPRILELYQRTQ